MFVVENISKLVLKLVILDSTIIHTGDELHIVIIIIS